MRLTRIVGGWRYQEVAPWGQIRLRPQRPGVALLAGSFWEVEWLDGSNSSTVTTPQLAEAPWLSGTDGQRWYPLVVPHKHRTRRGALRDAAAELERHLVV